MTKKPPRQSDYKLWEWVLIVIALVLLGGSSLIYVSGISVRKYLLGWDDGEGSEQVGLLGTKAGKVRRQLGLETEFKTIESSSTLYNYDTIMTSSEGGATLQLDDGGKIELGPDTMVRLAFDRRLGASRSMVEVVTGEVTGAAAGSDIQLRSRSETVDVSKNGRQSLRVGPKPKSTPPPVVVAAEPSPSPAPVAVSVATMLKLVEPKAGSNLKIEKLTDTPRRSVTLTWEVSPPDAELAVVLKKVGSSEEVLRKVIKAERGKATATADLTLPGDYEWELLGSEGQPLALKTPTKSRFVLDPEIQAIETLPPLVGGMNAKSNAYQGEVVNKFDVTLRWKEFPKTKSYIIRVTDKPDSKKALLERKVDKAEYLFNKDKIFSGQVYYKILVKLPSGFFATSKPELFAFNFLPPMLVIPEDKAVVSKMALASSDNSILMTWQKTNFTIGYEIEVATDVKFAQILVKKNVKENFFVLKSAPIGKYWWRVRSFSKEISSPFSMAYEITVNP